MSSLCIQSQFLQLSRSFNQKSPPLSRFATNFRPAETLQVISLDSKHLIFESRPSRSYISKVCMASSSSVVSTPKEIDDLSVKDPIVTVPWLAQHLDDVKVLDASWFMPAEKRNPRKEFEDERIIGSQFFDIDQISDPNTDLPHMLPTPSIFEAAASKLGLKNDDYIVVYDRKGIFSAARAWWMFRAFGHQRVWVLDGGLPAYKSQDLPLVSGPEENKELSEGSGLGFKAVFQPHLVVSLDDVVANLDSKKFQIVDARSKGRFDGADSEPRPGVRSGHIPDSFNVPFNKVLTPDGQLATESTLEATFKDAGLNFESPIVASCGTGVTACVLTLALFKIGKTNVPVYDGSWTEWGGNVDSIVATNV